MPLDFSRLYSVKYVFNPNLAPMSPNFAKALYFFFGLFLILSLVAWLMVKSEEKKKNLPLKKLWQKLTTFFLTLGIIGLLLLFFRQMQAYFLSLPLFLYFWFLGALIWLISIIRWTVKKMKKMQEEIEEKKEREKYLR